MAKTKSKDDGPALMRFRLLHGKFHPLVSDPDTGEINKGKFVYRPGDIVEVTNDLTLQFPGQFEFAGESENDIPTARDGSDMLPPKSAVNVDPAQNPPPGNPPPGPLPVRDVAREGNQAPPVDLTQIPPGTVPSPQHQGTGPTAPPKK